MSAEYPPAVIHECGHTHYCSAEATSGGVTTEDLERLDAALAWIADNYPKAMREMPTQHFRALAELRALSTTPPAP